MLTIENPNSFDWTAISLADCVEGNCWDTFFTLKLYEKFKAELEDDPRWDLYTKLIAPSSDSFLDLECTGILVSPEQLKVVGDLVRKDNDNKERELYSLPEVSADKSLTSNADQADILFLDKNSRELLLMALDGVDVDIPDKQGFNLYPPEYTDKNEPTVKREALETILSQIEEELNKRV